MNSSQSSQLAIFTLAAVIFLFQWRTANADWNVADVQCAKNENRLLIRFGMNAEHDAPIPLSLLNKWKNVRVIEVAGAPGVDCRLKNGQNIWISIATSKEVKTSGGGDLSGYFSLLVDEKTIYRNERFYQGQNLSVYDLSALEYDGKIFTACVPNKVKDFMGVVKSIDPKCHKASPPSLFN